jgi:hypothetical protein
MMMSSQSEEGSQLEELLLEGLASGEEIPMTPEFWKALKAEARVIAGSVRRGMGSEFS